jgi:hypothetical protein
MRLKKEIINDFNKNTNAQSNHLNGSFLQHEAHSRISSQKPSSVLFPWKCFDAINKKYSLRAMSYASESQSTRGYKY